VVNTTEGRQAIEDSHSLRRAALLSRIAYFTTMRAARAATDAIAAQAGGDMRVAPLQSYHLQRTATLAR
jgi:carbamoyl-phosphate synthase large subunit